MFPQSLRQSTTLNKPLINTTAIPGDTETWGLHGDTCMQMLQDNELIRSLHVRVACLVGREGESEVKQQGEGGGQ